MFEVVYETRKQGQTPDDAKAPLTSLVLNSTFDTEEKARDACLGFQGPFETKWEDPSQHRYFGETAKEPGKVSIWYYRPAD